LQHRRATASSVSQNIAAVLLPEPAIADKARGVAAGMILT